MTSHTVESYPKVVRVSTAVIVDGVHTYSEGEKGEGTWTYAPRSSEEMEKLEKIVKRAVNFNPDRGDGIEVVNIPFTKMDTGWDEGAQGAAAGGWLSYARKYGPSAKGVLLFAFLFCVFIFVVRPLLRWLTAGPASRQGMLVQLPKTVSEIESEYRGKPSNRDQAIDLIASDEENSLKLVRSWLSEGKA